VANVITWTERIISSEISNCRVDSVDKLYRQSVTIIITKMRSARTMCCFIWESDER